MSGAGRIGAGLLAAALLGCQPQRGAAADVDWQRQGRAALAEARALAPVPGRARNLILFLGDGMGLSTVTAARILEGQLRDEPGEENWLSFERLPHVALAKVYNTDQQTPDSAGTMTAIVTGEKTRAGMLSVDQTVTPGDYAAVEAHRLTTLFERAERRGLATGIVTTTTVTHATPAACYAHSPARDWESDAKLPEGARDAGFPDIARQLVEFREGDGIDVVLGGGRAFFLPRETPDPEYPQETGRRLDGRDLIAEWLARRPGSAWVWKRAQFEALDPERVARLIGLFEPSHLHFEVDRAKDAAGEPPLSAMTATAIDVLSRSPRGFVLMVEGGRIDHGHHLSNAYRALTETIEFARAVRVALDKTDERDTLVVVTADHGHVFTITGYPTRGHDILGKVVENDAGGRTKRPALDALGLPYTTLGYQVGPGYAGGERTGDGGVHDVHGAADEAQRSTAGRPDLSDVDTSDPDYVQESAVPRRSETHSGEDVPVYAGGPGAELVHGVQEQNFLYYVMVEALGWNDPAVP